MADSFFLHGHGSGECRVLYLDSLRPVFLVARQGCPAPVREIERDEPRRQQIVPLQSEPRSQKLCAADTALFTRGIHDAADSDPDELESRFIQFTDGPAIDEDRFRPNQVGDLRFIDHVFPARLTIDHTRGQCSADDVRSKAFRLP